MKLFLIGLPGSGKSYCAKLLKKKLKLAAYDLDDLVEMMEEMSVSEIFETLGEEKFRTKEAKMLRLFKEKKQYIVSCGGGTPCFHDNMEWMNNEGTTVWIDEPIDVLVQRLLPEKDQRPLLRNLDDESELKAYLVKLRTERLPFYSKAQFQLTSAEVIEGSFLKPKKQYA